jgi:hypothetical protein
MSERMLKMIEILAAAALMQTPLFVPPMPPDYNRYTDAQLCDWVSAFVARHGQQPWVRDTMSRRDNVGGSCPDRTLTSNWSITDSPAGPPSQWADEEHRNHVHNLCSEPFSPYSVLVRRGWRIITNYTFLDGTRVSLTLQC